MNASTLERDSTYMNKLCIWRTLCASCSRGYHHQKASAPSIQVTWDLGSNSGGFICGGRRQYQRARFAQHLQPQQRVGVRTQQVPALQTLCCARSASELIYHLRAVAAKQQAKSCCYCQRGSKFWLTGRCTVLHTDQHNGTESSITVPPKLLAAALPAMLSWAGK